MVLHEGFWVVLSVVRSAPKKLTGRSTSTRLSSGWLFGLESFWFL